MKVNNAKLTLVFRAFQYRNYRLFFSGQIISLMGTWTQQVALGWLVYRLTNSPFLLGFVAFSGQIPIFFISPFAGAIADRFDRRKLLLGIQTLSMIQALLLAALVLSGAIRTWHMAALSLFIGILNAFDIPTRQSFVARIVEKKEDLGNAVILNTAMFTSARFIGPSIAGVLISAFGEGICFLVNAASYIGILIALCAIRTPPKEERARKRPILHEIREGVSYVLNFLPVMAILILLATFSFAGSPYIVLMPVFARDVLHCNAQTFGFLMSASGSGAVAATIYLASKKNAAGLLKLLPVAIAICGASLAAFAFSCDMRLSVTLLFITGFVEFAQVASSNAIIQSVVDEDKRGRVMSLFAVALVGTMPFGSLLSGALAAKIGVQYTLLSGALICMAGGAVFALRLPRLSSILQPIFSRTQSEAGNK
jgi:MFS family permease